MTFVVITNETSINRINYGVSFQQLRTSKIAMSEYVYDYIITLPYNTIEHRNERIQACNSNSRNKAQTGPNHKPLPPNETPSSVDCSQALDSLINTLHDTDRDIHQEVNDLISRILDELPEEVMLRQVKKNRRAWFKGIGSVLRTVFGTMDEDESDKINERLKALERYTDDSSKSTKMEVSRLLTGERLLQAKVIDVLQELRQSTTALTKGI